MVPGFLPVAWGDCGPLLGISAPTPERGKSREMETLHLCEPQEFKMKANIDSTQLYQDFLASKETIGSCNRRLSVYVFLKNIIMILMIYQ